MLLVLASPRGGPQHPRWAAAGPLPHAVKVKIATQHGADVLGEPQRVQNWQQVEQRRIPRVAEPALYGDCIICQFRTREINGGSTLSRIN